MAKYKDSLLHLRNQHKIKDSLGEDILNIIKESIKSVMNSDKDIEPQKIDNIKYSIIMIDDYSDNNSMIVFYIIESKFNIYKIAFKEFI